MISIYPISLTLVYQMYKNILLISILDYFSKKLFTTNDSN